MLRTTSTSKHVTTTSKKRQIYSILLLIIFYSIIAVEVSMFAVRNKVLKKFYRSDNSIHNKYHIDCKAKSLSDTNYYFKSSVHNQDISTAQITERLFEERKQLPQETCNNAKPETFFRNVTTPTEMLAPENKLSKSKCGFTNVGEPFERRISGYRNTLEENHKLKNDVIKEIQSNITSNLPESTIREWLFCLVNRYKNCTCFDELWSPIYTKGTPCNINFNISTEAESFRQEAEYYIRLEKMRGERPGNSINVTKIFKSYISQIDQNLLQDVLQTYELDLAFVSYNSTKYFEYFQMNGQLHSPSKEPGWE